MRGKRPESGRRAAALAAGAALLLVVAAPDTAARPPLGQTPVAQGPILDPGTGSYFELRVDNAAGRLRPEWETANRRARSLVHKGRPGRLAVVGDMETLNFIRDNFRINEAAWIGLRFFCRFRQLVWVTGEIHPINRRDLWAPQWYLSDQVLCGNANIPYMPIFLTDERSGRVYWQATGPAKFFVSYFVEYPAPPAPESPSSQSEPGKDPDAEEGED